MRKNINFGIHYLGSRLAGSGCLPVENLIKDAATVPMIVKNLAKVKDTATYDQAAVIFDKMSLTPDYPEFLTLPLYEAME